MENKKINLNLDADENILYTVLKLKSEVKFAFILSLFSLPVLPIFTFLLLIHSPLLLKAFSLLIIFLMLYFYYITIRDTFFSNLILTNKRLFITRFEKVQSITYDEIESITSIPRGPKGVLIKLKTKKNYGILFIDQILIKEKVEKYT